MDNYELIQRDTGYIQRKTSYRGHPYWIWKPSLPRINDLTLKSVFFVYPSEQDAIDGAELGGSGFFYAVESEFNPAFGYIYAVTCKHIILKMENPVLRLNKADNTFDLFLTERNDWITHPDGSDLVASSFGAEPRRFDFLALSKSTILTDEFAKEKNVGPGDDVFMVGRFRVHAGKKKNLPKAMFGNISAMPSEPLKNPFTGLEEVSYIVELRSISGFSGAPVLLYISPFSQRFNKSSLSNLTHIRLLGILWGHINVWEKAKDTEGVEIKVKMSSAMAGVVPIQKLLELLNIEEFTTMRKEEDERLQKYQLESSISVDAEGKEKAEFTQDDMEKALKKAFKPKTEDETSDEEKPET